tara:strand:+ start:105 stop:641 length:537 start_codon:yes stop_codon:yes gene_type:complete
MDPGTIAIVVGSAISAMGALQAGANAQNTANKNAEQLFKSANAERLTGIENRKRQDRLNRKTTGRGKSLNLSDDVMNDMEMEMALMEADISYAAEVKAVSYENKGQMQIFKGAQARQAGYMSAASTMLMGGGMAGAGKFNSLFSSTTATPSVGGGFGGGSYNPNNINRVPGSPLLLST